jgi:phage terminase small subunit
VARTKGAINKGPNKAEREKSAVVAAKQKVFADAILEGHNPSVAARAAGYHPSNAGNVMRQEEIQELLAEGRRQLTDVTQMRRLDVMNIFIEAIDMARTLADPSQMINGADKVAKMMGYYAPETLKLEVETNSKAFSSKFRAMSDEELFQIAAGKAKVIDGEVL